jgi:hypothetical protein
MSVENNELTIIGRRSFPKVEGALLHHESRPENFRRTFELDPSIDADKISARVDQRCFVTSSSLGRKGREPRVRGLLICFDSFPLGELSTWK